MKEKKYFCGRNVTVADIVYYNEISLIVNLTKKELFEQDYPNLAVWYNETMPAIAELRMVEDKFKETIARYNFQ